MGDDWRWRTVESKVGNFSRRPASCCSALSRVARHSVHRRLHVALGSTADFATNCLSIPLRPEAKAPAQGIADVLEIRKVLGALLKLLSYQSAGNWRYSALKLVELLATLTHRWSIGNCLFSRPDTRNLEWPTLCSPPSSRWSVSHPPTFHQAPLPSLN